MIETEEVRVRTARVAHVPTGYFISAGSRLGAIEVEQLSQLKEQNRDDEVIAGLQSIEPRLERLSVLVTGGTPRIYGEVGTGRLVPFQLLGQGVGRLLSILLAIATAREGVVMVDEVENGVHHSVMKQVWQAIATVSASADVQVFATTHSWECIQAAQQAFDERGRNELRVHRLEQDSGLVRAVTLDQERLTAVVEAGWEIR